MKIGVFIVIAVIASACSADDIITRTATGYISKDSIATRTATGYAISKADGSTERLTETSDGYATSGKPIIKTATGFVSGDTITTKTADGFIVSKPGQIGQRITKTSTGYIVSDRSSGSSAQTYFENMYKKDQK
jgi:hypothetical protein